MVHWIWIFVGLSIGMYIGYATAIMFFSSKQNDSYLPDTEKEIG